MRKEPGSPLATMPKRAAQGIARRVDRLMERGSRSHMRGDVPGAVRAYREALRVAPWYAAGHYDLGLVYKYARRWRSCLRANLAALELEPENEGALWNAGIAATALRDWKTARSMWKRAGIRVPGRSGDPAGDFGGAVIRLNADTLEAETVWAQRICPARAVIMNIPLPQSGHRFGDLVLNDGAVQGSRRSGEREYPVFNELQRLRASSARTHAASVRADTPADIAALEAAAKAERLRLEDWTGSMRMLCLRCSYGVKHRHRRKAAGDAQWIPERAVGISAASSREVRRLLEGWSAQPGREVLQLYSGPGGNRPARLRNAWWNYEEFSREDG